MANIPWDHITDTYTYAQRRILWFNLNDHNHQGDLVTLIAVRPSSSGRRRINFRGTGVAREGYFGQSEDAFNRAMALLVAELRVLNLTTNQVMFYAIIN